MQLVPYLSFPGNAAEAMRFYEGVLGGRITILQTYGESPMAAGEGPYMLKPHEVMHARLALDGREFLMASDTPEPMQAPFGGFSLSLLADSVDEAERLFAALADGGQPIMPLAPSYWAERFGMLVDRFGVRWMVNYEGNPQPS